MRHIWDEYVCCSPFLQPLSLDELRASALDSDNDAVQFDFPDPTFGPEQLLADSQLKSAIAAFIDTLQPRDQELVKRVFWQGHSQSAVAESMGVSRMAICKAIKKITAQGRNFLAPYVSEQLFH
jgi:RNA polymerase sigma factor (sigma-70 family)